MKRLPLALSLAGAALACLGIWAFAPVAAQDKKADPELKTLRDKASYAIGQNIGKSLKSTGLDADPALLSQGLRDELAGKGKFGDVELREVLVAYQKEAAANVGAKNKKEGEAFLAANKKKKGVVTTNSGLQYIVLREGKGAMPKATDTVEVDYRGTLLNGTEFDSSYKRGEPTSFQVGDVIPGWIEGLQLMKVGSKYQFFIPSELAYGDQQRQGSPIPPNSVLIFEVELRKIGK